MIERRVIVVCAALSLNACRMGTEDPPSRVVLDAMAGQASATSSDGSIREAEGFDATAAEAATDDANAEGALPSDAAEDAEVCPAGEAPGAWGVPDRCDPTVPCIPINGSLCYIEGQYTGSAITRCRPGVVLPGWVQVGKDLWCAP